MNDIYLIDPDLNIPDSDSDELDDVTRTITPAQTEEVSSEDICTASSTGLTAHKLVTAQQGLTCTGGFLTCSSSGLKFSDNSVQLTASLGSEYFNWVSKTTSFTAELNKRYIIFGNNTPSSFEITLPAAANDNVIYFAVNYSTGTGFKFKPNGSNTVEGNATLIVDSTVVANKKIIVLIYNSSGSGNWTIYNV